jgi:hypothetical protein
MRNEHVPITEPLNHSTMHKSHKGHRLMMIACCIPMFIIGIALVATGVVGASFLIYAVVCTLMMALMMGGMHGNGKH